MYIEREPMIEEMQGLIDDVSRNFPNATPTELLCLKGKYEAFIEYIKEQPEADVQPVKRGRWIITDDVEHFVAICSECGRTEDSRDIKDKPYCHCGARMDGDTE